MRNGLKFLNEVKTETKRITWPSLKETGLTSFIVAVVVLIFGLFFLLADTLILKALQLFMEF